ncbi:NADH-quinone oxidoreductase subunit C [Seinonella peptonophila]|uniref:NADH-quinone oxidoreductase subunit C n=1 Tax=Seinonella peptonophila TaxID=112248 RepID=A0A1M4XT39_9BACL|nr:NADH-quinone oxidoreductase subunit C [Seinonella peptonophila]SHE96727.1 NADH-quinone oxidoreductase subunit C [Seinonella peptonophila]
MTEENNKEEKTAQSKEDQEKKPVQRPAARPRPRVKKEAPPPEPSPKEPLLAELVQQVTEKLGEQAIEESYVNQNGEHLLTLVVNRDHWAKLASLLKQEANWQYTYLQNCAGVDQQTYFEVVYHLYSLEHHDQICVHVKVDRDQPEIPSVVNIWPAANWHEREIYDLLGIQFTGHPNLQRILMPDEWEGYPLRKDYQPLDEGV